MVALPVFLCFTLHYIACLPMCSASHSVPADLGWWVSTTECDSLQDRSHFASLHTISSSFGRCWLRFDPSLFCLMLSFGLVSLRVEYCAALLALKAHITTR
ncbi:hypothetical protein DL98DRAFT_199263 [Cadophora sp. DSE1049]|nr:hypothetical protein DL98DRAFT_199263 [Cadophora sp. DSE1049]